MADNEITIELQSGNAVPPKSILDMQVGQTVRYTSPAGKVRIVFPNLSPFRNDNQTMTEVRDSEIAELVSPGTFTCRCFITLPDGKEVGWDALHTNSGGDHKVTKP
jgi:hypothetical protein